MLRNLKSNHFSNDLFNLACFLLCLAELLTITHLLQAQEYLWPTNASQCLTSSFAEFRSDHLHSGIDIKTWGREGYKVFATQDGYIWRIRVSPFGYGKALYEVLNSGEIVVYAHLQKFAPRIEAYVKRLQRRQGRYSLDHYLSPATFPVRKGELIAYTGSTGAGAPHLHFEIRDPNNKPFNPLQLGLPVEDNLAPIATKLSLSPRNLDSQVNGWLWPQIFDLQQNTATSFSYSPPIQIWGEIGVGVSAFDLADGVRNRLSVYKIQLLVDGQLLFESSYDNFSFEQTRQVLLDRDYRLMQWGKGKFHKLYLEAGNQLPFYNSSQVGTGVLITAGYPRWMMQNETVYQLFTPMWKLPLQSYYYSDQEILQILNLPYTYLQRGSHSLTIRLQDFYGNTSTVNAQLEVYRKIIPQLEYQVAGDVLTVSSSDSSRESLHASYVDSETGNWHQLTPLNDKSKNNALISTPNSLSFALPPIRPVAIRFEYLNSRENTSYPFFVFWSDYNYDLLTSLPEIQLHKLFLDNYVVFQITSAVPLFSEIQLELENPVWGIKELSLIQPDLSLRMAEFPLFDLSLDTTFIRVYAANGLTRILCVSDTLVVTRVPCDSSKAVVSADRNFIIKFRPQSHFQPLYVHTEILRNTVVQDRFPSPMVPIYCVEPSDVPLWSPVEIKFRYPKAIANVEKLGIYSPGKQRDWDFIDNNIDFEHQIIWAQVKNLGKFTLVQDLQAPEILRVFPRPGSSLRNRLPLIKVLFREQLSGIGSEEDIVLKLDGRKLICEYDPENESVSYQVESPLSIGKHNLYIFIRDNSGNVCEKTVDFYIRR
ncbi:hypothetical protein DRQ00_08850 [candidate division KSB1 bacterium]|nr:MAG: hypothetical protein DRQ00_08850 [candidate division KSB1 bacterium]